MEMANPQYFRRSFIKSLIAGSALAALDWNAFPRGAQSRTRNEDYDAVVIGSGLGGLSCAAAFARQGFRPLVLEQHSKPGGYATTFRRRDYIFDVSLHSTVVGERQGRYDLIHGFPEITEVEFVPHPDLYRAVYPGHDLRVPQRDIEGYIKQLAVLFPEEEEGVKGLFADMEDFSSEISRVSRAGAETDMSRFALDYPMLARFGRSSWGAMADARIKNPQLSAIVSSLWVYFGLPPSRLSSLYYLLPTLSYLRHGGCYAVGRSQKISDALVRFIEQRGGEVRCRTRVERILLKESAAAGVVTGDGEQIPARVVISNANPHDTFSRMMDEPGLTQEILGRMDELGISLSSFQVFLGLNRDLIGDLGIKDTEIFYYPDYDHGVNYSAMAAADLERGGYALTLYDNVYDGYSPAGKNTLNLLTLQGYDFWERYAADYFRNERTAYKKQKEEMADRLIDDAEKRFLPGLRAAIEVREVGTPLTNIRYTSNTRGAIYGWDQTLDNSGQNRFPHATPVANLYLAGAWTRPGHGYGAVIPSGLLCFAEIMKTW